MTAVEVTAGGRSAREVLDWSRDMVESALRPAADRLPPSMRRIAGYHFGWWDEHGRPAEADAGKALRPALVLLAAEAVGGAAAAALPAAVAVELAHNFSLLHDDVMDGDRTRRHRPTAWAVFGVSPAILAGDALLTLAFDVLATGGHPDAPQATRIFSVAIQELLEGQHTDVAFERRQDVELAECLSMAAGKTGALLGCACALGGLFGGGSLEQVEHLNAFGRDLGLAFQLVDDLLGIWGDPSVTGKPVYSDLRSRKKSLPVVAALTSATSGGRELAKLYHREHPLSDADLVRAAELVDAVGGRAWSQARADELLTRALGHLRSAGSVPVPVAELDVLARLVARRDH
ncbi:family 2 encapsulin nanocompartment cargo protein polyprenyl transferase [Streptosporangium sp. NBC_01756]|uniref:family 2 encapsulin nanocompartment cargo protein polyprenyl transferase n=1 Tax=Streptosporangium sp. NBC_01756 TaxID=2975950 RepID=UPI002DDC5A80|nr:family 2 encapsulin nanocompartment cargo protein polyprenyl transferase [Streptosporangium sp. NBC_01756]WSC87969.1 family 2 encapsulin nanocompartment cargo protein polyprenyl transferase [Streptosporangium sp. NBC_01756]